MKRQFHNHPVFRILWPAFYGLVVYLLILLLNNNLIQLTESFFSQELFFCVGLTYLIFEGNRAVIILRRKIFEDDDLNLGKALGAGLANLVVTVVIVMLAVNLYFRFVLGFTTSSSFGSETTIFVVIYSVSSMIYTLLIVSTMYLYQENKEQLEQERILTENLQLELARYQTEINPDLLYDTLETLIPMIRSHPEEGEDYIDKLALVYRYILSRRNTELVEAREEIEAATNVVDLLSQRFQGNIQLVTGTEGLGDGHLVIPGSLTTLVEEIIRSTIVTDSQPLEIFLENENDEYLVLRHKLNERLRPPLVSKEKQLQRAFSIYTEKPLVSVKAYGERFVKIPILQLAEEEPVVA